MEKIIAEIAEDFIKNLIKSFTDGEKSFGAFEVAAYAEAKSCAARVMSAYAEHLDAALAEDKVGRRELGYTVQRKGDERRVQTLVGEVTYRRTYYKKASGGYEYLADTALGVESRERVSGELSLALVTAARDMSYAKSSGYVTGGEVSRQTVMGCIRGSAAPEAAYAERRSVPELHVDADEAHITLRHGKKSEVPLISVYEGIEKTGNRHSCKNVFHISEYGQTPDALWEQALTEIERRYDLSDTKIYLHGDGGGWIQTGFEWIPNAVFVLDKYHKNKAIKAMTAGLAKAESKLYDAQIRWSLDEGDLRFFDELTDSICLQMPERADKIRNGGAYLKRFAAGISICKTDPGANNGGCTEPHVSHVLSARLSSRPMAWSKQTLKQFAPILAAGQATPSTTKPLTLPEALRRAASSAKRTFRNAANGLPHPDAIGRLPVSGKITGTQKILKLFA